ncbi:unnamed protein product [Coregonus sp. 'balchen']|nr:unnamed protein product [Coregonus sp. 'balchen']
MQAVYTLSSVAPNRVWGMGDVTWLEDAGMVLVEDEACSVGYSLLSSPSVTEERLSTGSGQKGGTTVHRSLLSPGDGVAVHRLPYPAGSGTERGSAALTHKKAQALNPNVLGVIVWLSNQRPACVKPRPAMEPWPAVAWVLLLMALADWMKTAQSKDFTEQDIIYLHPSTTPFPGGFKCFTCEEAPDNYECNRWAPDLYCPQEARYCYTRHKMDVEGDSVSVTKRCVALGDCLSTGCSEEDHEGTRAVFATTSPLSGTTGLSQCYTLTSCLLSFTLLIFSYV